MVTSDTRQAVAKPKRIKLPEVKKGTHGGSHLVGGVCVG